MTLWNLLRAADRNLYRFISGRQVNPPADEVKRSTIGRYAQDYSIRILVESGTYEGDTIDALKDTFSKVFSIELDDALFSKARDRFSHYPHISILHGDSARLLPAVLSSLDEPAVFWLDGHFSGTGTAKGISNTPILSELETILNHSVRNHVILIDDARLFIGENGYPTIKQLFSFIHLKGGDMCFSVVDDIIRILPRGTDGHANISSYQESWKQSAGRRYRLLRQPVKRFLLGQQSSRIRARVDIHAVPRFLDVFQRLEKVLGWHTLVTGTSANTNTA